MDKVLSYGMDRFYFYAVSMKTFYYTREKRYLEGFLYLQEQTKIAESKNNHYGICMLHRMTGVIQHSRGELPQAIASYKKAIDLYKKYGYTRNISREMLAIADCYRLECNYEVSLVRQRRLAAIVSPKPTATTLPFTRLMVSLCLAVMPSLPTVANT